MSLAHRSLNLVYCPMPCDDDLNFTQFAPPSPRAHGQPVPRAIPVKIEVW